MVLRRHSCSMTYVSAHYLVQLKDLIMPSSTNRFKNTMLQAMSSDACVSATCKLLSMFFREVCHSTLQPTSRKCSKNALFSKRQRSPQILSLFTRGTGTKLRSQQRADNKL